MTMAIFDITATYFNIKSLIATIHKSSVNDSTLDERGIKTDLRKVISKKVHFSLGNMHLVLPSNMFQNFPPPSMTPAAMHQTPPPPPSHQGSLPPHQMGHHQPPRHQTNNNQPNRNNKNQQQNKPKNTPSPNSPQLPSDHYRYVCSRQDADRFTSHISKLNGIFQANVGRLAPWAGL